MSIFDFALLSLCSITFPLTTFLISTRPGGVISSKAEALLEGNYGSGICSQPVNTVHPSCISVSRMDWQLLACDLS